VTITKAKVLPISLVVGALSCVLGVVLIFGTFYGVLRRAERWADNALPEHNLGDLYRHSPFSAVSAVGGVAAASFAFGFFICFSQLSSKAQMREEGNSKNERD
jgi:hypothetical protein